MSFIALTCPQCGGVLPRQAVWRVVKCPYCGSMVTKNEDRVDVADFKKALALAKESIPPASSSVSISGTGFRLMAQLGIGDHSEVYLAEKMHFIPERVVVKRSRNGEGESELRAEFDALTELQRIDSPGSAYYSQRLPRPVIFGKDTHSSGCALALRQPIGFWGSLEDVMTRQPDGIEPRHAVWMWRRILEVLGFVHENGRVHGDVHPGHLLVNPGDHGVLLIGWNRSRRANGRDAAEDLSRSAWSIRALLSGTNREPMFGEDTPEPIVELLKRASHDLTWCAKEGAAGIDAKLKEAALRAYGPPAFVQFDPSRKTV